MKKFFPNPLRDNGRNLLRHMGYGEHRGHEGKISYAKRITGGMYPRYHVYLLQRPNGLEIDLHIDQKEASYTGSSAHSGEYSGTLVEREMHDITYFIQHPQIPPLSQTPEKKEKRGLWDIIFG